MSHHPMAPLGVTAHHRAPTTTARRTLALLGLVTALAACTEESDLAAPRRDPTIAAAPGVASTSVAPMELTADAIGRLLPALEKDAAAPVGNALRALDAKLRDPNATAEAKDRAAVTLQNVLGQFTDPARADAADLDAMRLEVDDLRAARP